YSHQIYGLLAVLRLPDDFEIRLGCEDPLHPLPDDRVVVGEEHSNLFRLVGCHLNHPAVPFGSGQGTPPVERPSDGRRCLLAPWARPAGTIAPYAEDCYPEEWWQRRKGPRD